MVEYQNQEPSVAAPFKTDLVFNKPFGFSSGASMVVTTLKTLFHLRSHIPCPYSYMEGEKSCATFLAESEQLFNDIYMIFAWLENICHSTSMNNFQFTCELSFGVSPLNPAEVFHLHMPLELCSPPSGQFNKIQRAGIRDLVSSSSFWPQAPSFPCAFFALCLPNSLLRSAAELDLAPDSLSMTSELYCLPNYSSPISTLSSFTPESANQCITSHVKPLKNDLPDISLLKISNSSTYSTKLSSEHWWFLSSSLSKLVCF
ncbi:hypothetical protein DSO57_1003301 [Entomophthora muscae]|uniref:Uncharacterized protein n=1 Tax=Entomophthora muscae TaxID=34485 RepID=A0ACC2T8Q1_9FUNG|nr:hypothetical protein DSO57_1003301 [Entomophthora muscae]